MHRRRRPVPRSSLTLATLLGAAWCCVASAQTLVVGAGQTVELDGGATFDSVEVGEDGTLVLRGP